MQLNQNKILITGGNSGIGLEMVRQFYALGNKLIVTGRNQERLEQVQHEFPEVAIFACDLGKQAELDRLILYLEQEHADLNILINNAGTQYNYSFMEEKDLLYKIENEIRVNLIAPTQLIALCLPILVDKPNAAVVNVSSGLGLVPKHSAPVYCGTKAGLHIFSQALRYQLKDHNIKVFEVIPPLVDTPMTKGRGTGKITAEQLVREFLSGFQKDKYEISIGKVKLLKILNRVFPRLAASIMIKN